MKIRYYLLENLITSDPNDRRAQVCDYETISEAELFEYMTRKGSGITTAEAKGNYEEIVGAFDYFLKMGYGINTEFINIRPVIPGVFIDDNDKFDPVRHKIKFKAHLGRRYNRTADDIKVEKVVPVNNLPLPTTIEDIASETINEMLTPGGVASLSGMRLLFKQGDPVQGIFLIDSDKNETRIEKILTQTGKQTVFQIPASLTPGEYSLEVRSLPPKSKTLRTGKLPEKLIV